VKTLIVGCGYVGFRVARSWIQAGHVVWGTTRDPEKQAKWVREAIHPIVWNVAEKPQTGLFPAVDVVLYAVGYRKDQPFSRSELHRGGLSRLLEALPVPPKRVLYVSSTGVYGDSVSGIVNEETPANPSSESGKAILEAEQFLQGHPWNARVILLRLAGIYGPERIPIPRNSEHPAEDGLINLIHVEDAVRAIILAAEAADPPRTFVISDGAPVLRSAFQQAAAEILGGTPKMNSDRPPRKGGGKRIDPSLIQKELGFQCEFSTYREGLQAIADLDAGVRR
jgi:nucleoside-diphosphate-sugar epimerase